MMVRLIRVLRHRWEIDASHTLPTEALDRLRLRVAASEQEHSGEIRICIEAALPNSYLWRKDTMPALLRQRAMAQFGRLQVWDTEHNNGVLIYLCLAEHAIELVADRGVNRIAPANYWEAIIDTLGAALKRGAFEEGLGLAVDAVGSLLQKHFALSAGESNPNELPDAPSMN
jgi:uncharacterized membrane protein